MNLCLKVHSFEHKKCHFNVVFTFRHFLHIFCAPKVQCKFVWREEWHSPPQMCSPRQQIFHIHVPPPLFSALFLPFPLRPKKKSMATPQGGGWQTTIFWGAKLLLKISVCGMWWWLDLNSPPNIGPSIVARILPSFFVFSLSKRNNFGHFLPGFYPFLSCGILPKMNKFHCLNWDLLARHSFGFQIPTN